MGSVPSPPPDRGEAHDCDAKRQEDERAMPAHRQAEVQQDRADSEEFDAVESRLLGRLATKLAEGILTDFVPRHNTRYP